MENTQDSAAPVEQVAAEPQKEQTQEEKAHLALFNFTRSKQIFDRAILNLNNKDLRRILEILVCHPLADENIKLKGNAERTFILIQNMLNDKIVFNQFINQQIQEKKQSETKSES